MQCATLIENIFVVLLTIDCYSESILFVCLDTVKRILVIIQVWLEVMHFARATLS